MKAGERAFLTVDLWTHKQLPDISQNERDLLCALVEQAILDAQRETMENCIALKLEENRLAVSNLELLVAAVKAILPYLPTGYLCPECTAALLNDSICEMVGKTDAAYLEAAGIDNMGDK